MVKQFSHVVTVNGGIILTTAGEKMGSTICFLTYLSQYHIFLGLKH